MIRGDHAVTAATVAEYYNQATELISADLGGSLHFGYWRGLPENSSMQDASRQMTELMISKLPVGPGQRVLDVGCGAGRPAADLSSATGASVVGVDISPRQIELATQLAETEGLQDKLAFRIADVMSLPFEANTLDAAWLFESMFHMPDQSRVLEEISRVLRPGGTLAIANLVQRVALTEEQNAALEAYWKVGNVAALLPLEDYPKLLNDSGLVLTELTDISEDTTRPTFDAIGRTHASRAEGHTESLAPGELASQMDAGMSQFIATPEIGFAIIVASKPS